MAAVFEQMMALCSESSEVEESVSYFAACLESVIKKSESVLICFPHKKENTLGAIAGRAVEKCGGIPVYWDEDRRWKTLLRLAFLTKASTIIASPLVVLGLSKLAAHEGIPLYLYNVVLAGYPCLDWMIDGIEKELDCLTWGFFGPGAESVVSGFSCQCGRGVHIRDDKFIFTIEDTEGNELPDGSHGQISLALIDHPSVKYTTKAFGSIMDRPCPCGNPSPKLVGIDMGSYTSKSVLDITEELLYWNSILDCSVQRTEFGLELEVVCFRGEKLPKFPSCAKLVVRAWDPETDVPLSMNTGFMKP